MPTQSDNLGIQLPLGNELVSRQNLIDNIWAIIDAGVVANKGGVPAFKCGADAAKPAPDPTKIGRFFITNDLSPNLMYRDTGTEWEIIGGSGGEGPENFIATYLTLNVPAEYDDVQAALDAIRNKTILGSGFVTIEVAAGHYTSPGIVVNHPNGDRIVITGATPAEVDITGVGTITGSAGNWSVEIVAPTVLAEVGDYVLIAGTTGTGDHYAFRGCWEITDVSGGGFTVLITHQAAVFPTATLTGGGACIIKTILSFATATGLSLSRSKLYQLENIVLVGDGSNNYGVYCDSSGLRLGIHVGVSGFGLDGICVTNNSNVIIGTCYVSNCDTNGFSVSNNSAVTMNSSNGYFGSYLAYSGASGNVGGGVVARDCSSVTADYFTSAGNGTHGFLAKNSSFVSAENSSASGNITNDYTTEMGSAMRIKNYTGTPVISPTLETVGNLNSIITET